MKYLILSFVFPIYSFAVFEHLYEGYKNSDRLKSLNLADELKVEDINYQKSQFDWQLELSSNYSDSFLQSLFSFQSNQTITQTHSLSLTKQSFHYGSFSIGMVRSDYDLSNWSSSGLNSFNTDKVYEYRNQLSYSYDFFKKPLSAKWDSIVFEQKVNEYTDKMTKDQDALNFFESYIQTKLRVVLNRLYGEFEKRANKRVSLVGKRVRDGLSRKVELNQAKISLLTQKETTLKNKTLMKENVYLLENIIGYSVPEQTYINIQWPFKKASAFKDVLNKSSFIELDRLKALNELNQSNLLQAKEEASHSLALKLSYTKNAVDESRDEAFDNALGDGKNDEKIVGLTYSIPFGEGKSSARERQLLVQKKKNLIDYNNLKGDYQAKETALLDNLEAYLNSIELSQSKVNLAKLTISQTQDLYLKGKLSFEDLLRAEEGFLNAQVSLVNNIYAYESSLAQLTYLYGTLDKFLTQYVD